MNSSMTTVYSMPPGMENRVCNFVRQVISVEITEQLHTHAFIKVMRITGGKAEWVVNNRCHILEEGCFVILNESEMRRIKKICSDEPLEMDWFQFQPLTLFSQMPVNACMRLCSIFYSRPKGFSNVITPDSANVAEIASAYTELVKNAEQPGILQDEAVIGRLYSLLVEITRHYTKLLGNDFLDSNIMSIGNFQKMTEAISYVREHYMEEITEQHAARFVYMSPHYFSKLFQAYYGIRFRSYLRQYRMEKTLELLRSHAGSNMNILDAALSCGFTSASGFYKCLNDLYGEGGAKEIIRRMKDSVDK